MLFRMSLVKEWHNLCAGYYEALLEGCLDEDKMVELHRKIRYHRSKLTANTATDANER